VDRNDVRATPGAHVLLSGKDVEGEIVDLLVVRREVLEQHPEKVKRLLDGCLKAGAILKDHNHELYPRALECACLFNGKAPDNRLDANNLRANSPCSALEHEEMSAASQMRWGDWQANREFFDRPGGTGDSKYYKLYLKHQDLMRRDLTRTPHPAESDGSSILRELEGR
jgi:hypothetical protein